MESILITPRSKTELKFITQLLEKIGLNSKRLSEDEKLDLGLAYLMSQADSSDVVDTDEFKRSLAKK